MKLDHPAAVQKFLLEAGLVSAGEALCVEPLKGGVSSRVWLVERDAGTHTDRWVIKQALEKLNVQVDWFSDVTRIHREQEVMQVMEPILPGRHIPKVLHADYTRHVYLMTAAEEAALTWKEQLMAGKFNPDTARQAATLLRLMHTESHRIPEEYQAELKNQRYFIQLRIDPFHRFLMPQYPELAGRIQTLIDELTLFSDFQAACLVHGDFSPKNMLVEQNGNVVLIDYEVAHWGNPVFDLAYCLGHLLLKGWYLNRKEEMLQLIRVFLGAYQPGIHRLLPHLGLMLLARMDGKSPVHYIVEEALKQTIRRIARQWINCPDLDADPLEMMEKGYGV
ncbi:aminoglycoside phosphotransferase family protein [soil metagenome]